MASFTSNGNYSHSELERRERKRHQNRIAQRAYRRNQKQRLQALEAAVANAASLSQISPPQEDELVDLRIQVPEYPYEDPSWDILHDPFPKPAPSRTAFHHAICDGKESMARILLEHGADVMKTDGNGKTALHLAAEYGSESIMRLLLSKAADPSVTDHLGRTALFSAVQGENEATAKALLEASLPSIDINWKDTMGMNALHLAVDCGFESMVKLLLTHGADPNS